MRRQQQGGEQPGDAAADDHRPVAPAECLQSHGSGHRQHALDRGRARHGDRGIDRHLVPSSSPARGGYSASVMRFMCGQRLHGRTNSTVGMLHRDVVAIEHSVSSTTRAGCSRPT